jgi:hypothetical protein
VVIAAVLAPIAASAIAQQSSVKRTQLQYRTWLCAPSCSALGAPMDRTAGGGAAQRSLEDARRHDGQSAPVRSVPRSLAPAAWGPCPHSPRPAAGGMLRRFSSIAMAHKLVMPAACSAVTTGATLAAYQTRPGGVYAGRYGQRPGAVRGAPPSRRSSVDGARTHPNATSGAPRRFLADGAGGLSLTVPGRDAPIPRFGFERRWLSGTNRSEK